MINFPFLQSGNRGTKMNNYIYDCVEFFNTFQDWLPKEYKNYKPAKFLSILQVLCKYKIVQKNLFKWTELNSVRFYVIRKISTCQ